MSRKRAIISLDSRRVTALKSTAVFDLPVGEDGKRVAPTEFRVFPAGPFTTTKGIFIFSPKSAQDVMTAHAARALPLMGDYEHQTDAESFGFPPMEAPASATEMTPEIRANAQGQPELWVKDVKWTDRAKSYLESGEYRLFSPVFGHTPDGEITSINRIALTNKPAMDGLVPLVAATEAEDDAQESDMKCTNTECVATATELSELKARCTALSTENEQLTAKLKTFDQWAQEEKKEHEQLTALTGQTDKAAILGVLTANAAAAKELTTLKATVESERVARLTAEYNTLAEGAVKEGRLPPAVRAKCDDIAKTDGIEKALSFLTAFAGSAANPVAPKVTVLSTVHQEPANQAVLTEEEVKFCKDAGIPVDRYVSGKRARA